MAVLAVAHLKPKHCDICGNKYEGVGEYYDKYPNWGYMNAAHIFLAKQKEVDEVKTALLKEIFPDFTWLPTVGKWYITAGYGSVIHDMNIFEILVPDLDKVFDGLVICDSCISALESDKQIVKVYDPYDNVEKPNDEGTQTPDVGNNR